MEEKSRLSSRRKSIKTPKICPKKEKKASIKRVSLILRKPESLRTEEERGLLLSCCDEVAEINFRQARSQRNKDRCLEVEDLPDVQQQKCQQLYEAIVNAKHLIVYTGAGISTSAQIPDYRGSQGIWTLLQKGQDIGNHDLSQAEPTRTHMALTELHKRGIVKHVVSQNCDGLHLRSGLPKQALSEVHGNMYIEVCRRCQPVREYWRLFDTTQHTARYAHRTGRRCRECGSALQDSIVHFGERGTLAWPLNWKGATKHIEKADVILCLGSSLKVLKRYPWLWAMDRPPRRRPLLYIVNLQWTPKDDVAVLKINGRVDEVITHVMNALDIKIPAYERCVDPIFKHATKLLDVEKHTSSQPSLLEESEHANATINKTEPEFTKSVIKEEDRNSQENTEILKNDVEIHVAINVECKEDNNLQKDDYVAEKSKDLKVEDDAILEGEDKSNETLNEKNPESNCNLLKEKSLIKGDDVDDVKVELSLNHHVQYDNTPSKNNTYIDLKDKDLLTDVKQEDDTILVDNLNLSEKLKTTSHIIDQLNKNSVLETKNIDTNSRNSVKLTNILKICDKEKLTTELSNELVNQTSSLPPLEIKTEFNHNCNSSIKNNAFSIENLLSPNKRHQKSSNLRYFRKDKFCNGIKMECIDLTVDKVEEIEDSILSAPRKCKNFENFVFKGSGLNVEYFAGTEEVQMLPSLNTSNISVINKDYERNTKISSNLLYKKSHEYYQNLQPKTENIQNVEYNNYYLQNQLLNNKNTGHTNNGVVTNSYNLKKEHLYEHNIGYKQSGDYRNLVTPNRFQLNVNNQSIPSSFSIDNLIKNDRKDKQYHDSRTLNYFDLKSIEQTDGFNYFHDVKIQNTPKLNSYSYDSLIQNGAIDYSLKGTALKSDLLKCKKPKLSPEIAAIPSEIIFQNHINNDQYSSQHLFNIANQYYESLVNHYQYGFSKYIYSGLHSIIPEKTKNIKKEEELLPVVKQELQILTEPECTFCFKIYEKRVCQFYAAQSDSFKVTKWRQNKEIFCECCDWTDSEDESDDKKENVVKQNINQTVNQEVDIKTQSSDDNDEKDLQHNGYENSEENVESGENENLNKNSEKNKTIQAGWFGKGYRKNRKRRK